MPANLQDDDFGRGLGEPSVNDRGNLIVSIAQAGSPAFDSHDPNYIADLEPGDIYIKNLVSPVFKEGLDCIPCFFKDVSVEWLEGRQGFVAEHDQCPDDVKQHAAENSRRPILIRESNGNLIVPTRNIYLLVLPDCLPCVLPAWSSRLTFARNWRIWMLQQRDEKGRQLPAYAHQYRLQTTMSKNGLGRWYGLRFEDLGGVTGQQLAAGREFSRFVEGGNFRITSSNIDPT
jgi:hypothetical protein